VTAVEEAPHPLSYVVVALVSAVLGLFLAGFLGAVVLVVLGLVVFAVTARDLQSDARD